MTSAQIRQSFLDFFREKGHTIVPSSPLLPDSPNLLFTNAGMNQFVPIFPGQAPCSYPPARAADTQKCIRPGGHHHDLHDFGFYTSHHTSFAASKTSSRKRAAHSSTGATPAASKSGTSSSSNSTPPPTARSWSFPPGTSTPAWASSASRQ